MMMFFRNGYYGILSFIVRKYVTYVVIENGQMKISCLRIVGDCFVQAGVPFVIDRYVGCLPGVIHEMARLSDILKKQKKQDGVIIALSDFSSLSPYQQRLAVFQTALLSYKSSLRLRAMIEGPLVMTKADLEPDILKARMSYSDSSPWRWVGSFCCFLGVIGGSTWYLSHTVSSQYREQQRLVGQVKALTERCSINDDSVARLPSDQAFPSLPLAHVVNTLALLAQAVPSTAWLEKLDVGVCTWELYGHGKMSNDGMLLAHNLVHSGDKINLQKLELKKEAPLYSFKIRGGW